MKRLLIACSIAAAVVTVAHAQDSLLGTWTGSYPFPGPVGPIQLGVQLIIASVENGLAKGTATLSTRGPCSGEYPMEGKSEDNKLSMKATAKGGRFGDCSFSFNVVREGNKLVGTTGTGRSLQLSK